MNKKIIEVQIMDYPDLKDSEIFKYLPRIDQVGNGYYGKHKKILNKELTKEYLFAYYYKELSSEEQKILFISPIQGATTMILGNTRSAVKIEVRNKCDGNFKNIDVNLAKKLINDHVDYAWDECWYNKEEE